MKKLVSIIVPVHNSSKYLASCIDSILNQTYKNIEIIVIENGSTDNSLEILKSYESQIKLEILENPGLSKARNKGIELSNGDYIAFVDSDDYIEKNMLETLVNDIEKNNSDLSICNITEKHENTNKVINRNVYPNNIITQNEIITNLEKFNFAVWNKLYKKEIITKNNITFPNDLKYEDIVFSIAYLSKCNKISKINECLYNYLVHNESEQTTVDKRVYDIIKILNLCKKYATHENLENLYVQELTTYALKMRYVSNQKLRKEFINTVYNIISQEYPNWKKSSYIQNMNAVKRTVIKNKTLLKLYTSLYRML